jgi:predicted phage terminase large subunit-like protein
MAGRWRPVQWGEDKAQVERSIGPFLDKRQQELSVYCHREKLPCSGDKAMRAQAIRGRISQGKVYFPSNAQWTADLIYEMMQFDNGKYDDQVDVLSLFGRMLSVMRPPVSAGRQFRVIRGHMNRKQDWAK